MIFDGIGKYGIPKIEPTQFENCEFIGFNYANSQPMELRSERGIHFFLDDYQFNRVWAMPDRYINLLSQYKYVLSPDFSTYTDFPMAMQIYNHYRKHWLAAYWQAHGIKVIPTISWSTEESFEWCFDGEPEHSTVAVSSVGTQANIKCKSLFVRGYEKMIEVLAPDIIIFYGNIPDECLGNIMRVRSYQDKFKEAMCGGW